MTRTALPLLMAAGAVATLTAARPAHHHAKAAPAPAPTPAPAGPPPIDRNYMHVEVILDHLGFSPGIIDGRPGQSFTAALKGFQEAKGLPATGQPDPATLHALYPYRGLRPTRTMTLTADMLAGPYVAAIPKDEDAQAKLPGLYYKNPMEKLGEMFHTTPDVITALNPPGTKIAPGTKLTVPDIAPGSQNYDPKAKPEWRATLAQLNVDANEPQASKVVVSKSQKVLKVYDQSNKLVAQFQVTTGSTHDPLPLGTWKITSTDTNPPFHYNPALFWDAKATDKKALLPPGPNGPVGVVWMNLTKEHYGIHGTPEPQLIGRTESHGCVRLANWNAARLALMVKPGTPAIFTE